MVQAVPKTQLGGVHGARFRLLYQSDEGPSFINRIPNASPPKLINKKSKIQ